MKDEVENGLAQKTGSRFNIQSPSPLRIALPTTLPSRSCRLHFAFIQLRLLLLDPGFSCSACAACGEFCCTSLKSSLNFITCA